MEVKAELYEFEMDKWTLVEDYPYGPRIIQYVMLFIPETAGYYVIGGEDANYSRSSTIAMFHDGAWSMAGQLNQSRTVKVKGYFKITDSISETSS